MPYTLTRTTSTTKKLYNREPSSTIDPYKNGENAYIYSKTTIAAKKIRCIKNIVVACLLTVCACRLWPIMHPRLGVPSTKSDNYSLSDATLTQHGSCRGDLPARVPRANFSRPPIPSIYGLS
jgi:hypothetical protein